MSHIDTTQSPGQIDIHLGATAWSTAGRKLTPLNATSMKGIFEFRRHESDPKKDSLRWCFAKPNQPRPTNFNVDAGSGHTSVELQRYIVDEEDAVAKLRQAGATIYKDDQGGWVSEIVLPETFDSKIAVHTIPDLRKLSSVVSYRADNELVASLKGHQTIRSLRLRCQIPADQLDHLTSSLPNLKTLGFHCKDLTTAYCSAIQKGKSISWLKIGGNKDNLSSLNNMKGINFWKLSLTECELNKESLHRIADCLPNLTSLEIADCTLSPNALSPLTRMAQLKNLDFSGKSINDAQLMAIKSHSNVHIIEISDTAVTNSSLNHILQNFPDVFSVGAENVAFDREIFKVIDSVPVDRQFSVTVSSSSISLKEVEDAGPEISARIHVNRYR